MKYLLIILTFLFSFVAIAALETDRQEQAVYNFYGANSGFENNLKDVTVSSATKTWDGSVKHTGNKSLKCNFDAIGDYCELKLVNNPASAMNMEYGFYYKTPSATIKAEIIDSAGNIVRVISPLPSNTAFSESILDFVAAASTTYKIRWTELATATESINIDTVHMSKNMNIGSVNLANKTYDLKTVCSGATCISGATANTATAIPYKDRDGNWRAVLNIDVQVGSASGGSFSVSGITFKTYDSLAIGNTSTSQSSYYAMAQNATSNIIWGFAGAVTQFSVAGDVSLTGKPTWATDTVSEQVVRAESANQSGSVSWSAGYHYVGITNAAYEKASTATFASDRTYRGSASAPANSNDLAFKVNNLNPGSYKIIFTADNFTSGTGANCIYSIYDGTNYIGTANGYIGTGYMFVNTIIGEVTYTSLQTSREFSIYAKLIGGTGTCTVGTNSSDSIMRMSIEPVYPTANMPQIIGAEADSQMMSKQYALTVTGDNSWSTTRAVGIPYFVYDTSGNKAWRLKFNISGTVTSNSNTTLALLGIVFKTVSGGQAGSLMDAGYTTGGTAQCGSGSNNIAIRAETASTIFVVSGDVELDSKPTFLP